jgi:hypothetical protein
VGELVTEYGAAIWCHARRTNVMTMKWFLVVWLISPSGEYLPGYKQIGYEDRLQPSREVCIERAAHNNTHSADKFWTCFGYFS